MSCLPVAIANVFCLDRSGKLKVPEWVDIVKTGIHKELAPSDPDWFYTRCAAIARHLYIRAPAGVGAFTKIYGGKKRRGVRPANYVKGSSSVARKSLQALETFKWVEKSSDGGRRLTTQGKRDLDRIAAQVKVRNNKAAKIELLLLSQQ